MFDFLRRRTPEPPGFDPDRLPDSPRDRLLDAADGSYRCHAVDSPDGRWTLAYGRRTDGESSRFFRLRNDEIRFAGPATRPAVGAIANSGRCAIVERVGSETTTSRLRVFDGETETAERTITATVSDTALSPDGSVVAVATRQPDAAVRAYGTAAGEELWTVTPRRTTPRLYGFHLAEEPLLYVARERRPEPYLALTLDGAVEWGNERYQATRPITDRVRTLLSRR